MTRAQDNLLDVIRAFKKEGTSDLEAALNVIANHADTIAGQAALLREFRKAFDAGYFFVTRGEGRDVACALLDRLNDAIGDHRSKRKEESA